MVAYRFHSKYFNKNKCKLIKSKNKLKNENKNRTFFILKLK